MNTTDIPLHRIHAIGFIKHSESSDYTFAIPANDVLEGQRFVQRVRVELSRMRTYVRNQGHAVKPFRMRLVSVEFVAEPQDYENSYCKIVLRKDAPDAQIARDVSEVFGLLTNGGAIEQ